MYLVPCPIRRALGGAGSSWCATAERAVRSLRAAAVTTAIVAAALASGTSAASAQVDEGPTIKPRIVRTPADTSGDTTAASTATSTAYPEVTSFTPTIYRGSTTVDFRWGGAAGSTSTVLLKGPSANGPFQRVANATYADHWARDPGGTVGSTAYYVVVAYYPGPSGPNTGSAKSAPAAVSIPTGPQGITYLQGTSPGGGTVVLTWVRDPEAIGYDVWRWNGTNREAIYQLDAYTATFTDRNLLAGHTFRYSVFGRYLDRNTSAHSDVSVTVH